MKSFFQSRLKLTVRDIRDVFVAASNNALEEP